jgi:hypothetical protein
LYFPETITAVNRPVAAWLERNLSIFAAAGAYSRVHLTALAEIPTTITSVLILAGCAAIRAAARLVGKAFLRKEFLF